MNSLKDITSTVRGYHLNAAIGRTYTGYYRGYEFNGIGGALGGLWLRLHRTREAASCEGPTEASRLPTIYRRGSKTGIPTPPQCRVGRHFSRNGWLGRWMDVLKFRILKGFGVINTHLIIT